MCILCPLSEIREGPWPVLNITLPGESEHEECGSGRAGAVVDYLVSRGLSANQVTTRYHGERYPLTSNNTAQGRSENRRVTIRLERLPPRLSQR